MSFSAVHPEQDHQHRDESAAAAVLFAHPPMNNTNLWWSCDQNRSGFHTLVVGLDVRNAYTRICNLLLPLLDLGRVNRRRLVHRWVIGRKNRGRCMNGGQ